MRASLRFQGLSVGWRHIVFLSVVKGRSLLPPSYPSEQKECEAPVSPISPFPLGQEACCCLRKDLQSGRLMSQRAQTAFLSLLTWIDKHPPEILKGERILRRARNIRAERGYGMKDVISHTVPRNSIFRQATAAVTWWFGLIWFTWGKMAMSCGCWEGGPGVMYVHMLCTHVHMVFLSLPVLAPTQCSSSTLHRLSAPRWKNLVEKPTPEMSHIRGKAHCPATIVSVQSRAPGGASLTGMPAITQLGPEMLSWRWWSRRTGKTTTKTENTCSDEVLCIEPAKQTCGWVRPRQGEGAEAAGQEGSWWGEGWGTRQGWRETILDFLPQQGWVI